MVGERTQRHPAAAPTSCPFARDEVICHPRVVNSSREQKRRLSGQLVLFLLQCQLSLALHVLRFAPKPSKHLSLAKFRVGEKKASNPFNPR